MADGDDEIEMNVRGLHKAADKIKHMCLLAQVVFAQR